MFEIGPRKLKFAAQIGLGSLAEIYAARDMKTGEPFAVKMLRPQWQSNPGKIGRFLEEGATGSVFNHPNIVRYYYAPKENEPKNILMELVEGITLDKVLIFELRERRSAFPSLIRQLASALGHIHARGYVHRDVNPHNIMVTEENQVKLIDFGLCLNLKKAAAMEWQRCGTPGFMAPEQIRFTTDITHRADIYSLGCIIYLLAAGAEPFPSTSIQGKMTSQINRDAPPPSMHNRDIPPELDELILQATSRNAKARPPTAELLAARACALADKAGLFDMTR